MKIAKNSTNMSILIAVMGLFLISCSSKESKKELNYSVSEVNGIQVYSNKNKPSDENFAYNLKKELSISGEDDENSDSLRFINTIDDIQIDKNGNYFVLDSKNCTFKKFDNNGKYLKSFLQFSF